MNYSSSFYLRKSGSTEKSKERALQAHFAAGGFVPFLQGMCAASGAAGADGDGVNAVGERDVGVGGGALDARLVANIFVGGAQRGEQRRIGGQFPAGTAAEGLHLPFEFPLGAIASGFHFVANAGGDAFAQSGLELGELVFTLGANVDLKFGFVGDGIDGSAAFDLADVESSARSDGNFGVDETDGGAHQGIDGIGHAEVRPTVAAWATDSGFEA